MRKLWVCVGLLVVQSAWAAPTLRPVGPELLNGRSLVSRKENFSIEAPEGWSWLVADAPDGHMYICRGNSESEYFALLTQSDGRVRMSESAAKRFLKGVTAGIERQGGLLTDVEFRGSSRPFADYEISGSVKRPDVALRRFYGHFGVRDRLYALQATLEDGTDTQRFERFLDSFRLLTPVSAFSPMSIAFTCIAGCLVLTAMWLAAYVCRWSARHQRITWYLPIFGAMGIFYLGAAWYSLLKGNIRPDKLDGILGQVTGFTTGITVVLLIVVARHRVTDKRLSSNAPTSSE